MRQTSDALQLWICFCEGFVDFIRIGLDGALETTEFLPRHLLATACAELQNHVFLGHRVEPQIASRCLTGYLAIQHFHWRFIDLQIVTGLHRLPHGLVDRLEPAGDVLHPLHHLLPRDLHTVAFLEDLLQTIEREMIIKASQKDIHRQAQPQLALRNQPRRQRRDHHAGFHTPAGILRADDPPADQLRGNIFELFGDFLTDAVLCLPAVRANGALWFQRYGLGPVSPATDAGRVETAALLPPVPVLPPRTPACCPTQGVGLVPEDHSPVVPVALLVPPTGARPSNQRAAVSVLRCRLWPRPTGLVLRPTALVAAPAVALALPSAEI